MVDWKARWDAIELLYSSITRHDIITCEVRAFVNNNHITTVVNVTIMQTLHSNEPQCVSSMLKVTCYNIHNITWVWLLKHP